MDVKDLAILIASIGACVTSIIGAVFAGYATLYAAKAKAHSEHNGQAIEEVKGNVQTIEKATNSMKDALVKATGDAAFLEGKAEERRNPEIAAVPVAPVTAAVIRADIAAVPEKTAAKVVEKLHGDKPI